MKSRTLDERLIIAANENIEEKKYWLRKLAGEPVKSSFPQDRYGETQEYRPALWNRDITGELFHRLIKLSNNSDIRLYMILLTGLILLLERYTGNPDVRVGTAIYKQENREEFLNTLLPLRNVITPNMTVKELLLAARKTVVEANENYAYPMEVLREELKLGETEGDNPWFDVALMVENIHEKEHLTHLRIGITVSFRREETSLHAEVQYDASRYGETMVEQIMDHYAQLLAAALENIDAPVKNLEMMTETEKYRLLEEFNHTSPEPGKNRERERRFVHRQIEEQVKRSPDHIAVIHGEHQLSYRELDKKAAGVAAYLRTRGVEPGHIVAIWVETSIEMVAGILGILKAGAAYLPIDTEYPQKRIQYMLKDSGASFLLTKTEIAANAAFTALQDCGEEPVEPVLTAVRPQVKDFDSLPMPDRSLVDYEKYHRYIGEALAKHTMTLQATRGCPYKCAFCHKIWPKSHVVRSAENIFREVKTLYDIGVKRFVFVDDIFNLDENNSRRFFQAIIDNGLKVQLFFTNGLRGDILKKDYIDLMVEAGTVDFDFSLESASPRIQKVIQKHLNIDKLKENIEYIIQNHPHVIVELQTMHGFPTETEEEALKTLEYIKGLQWIDFPYVHFVRIYPGTDMERVALANGVSPQAIKRSLDLAFDEFAETSPFTPEFSQLYQTRYLNEYFLNRERFLKVLPKQMQILSESELIQKYDSYFHTDITCLDDLLKLVGITREDLGGVQFVDESKMAVPQVNEKIRTFYPIPTPTGNRTPTPAPVISGETGGAGNEPELAVLLLDLSQYFSAEADVLYDVYEAPLGLMYLMTYLKREFGDRIRGKIAKSRLDFDNNRELKLLLQQFKPDVIGIRTLSHYKDFFHRSVTMMRQWGIDVPIVAGGPYATSSYREVLQDDVDLVVMGEGEVSFAEIVGKIMENRGKLPAAEQLKEIQGIAYIHPNRKDAVARGRRDVLFLDEMDDASLPTGAVEPEMTASPEANLSDTAYIIYTGGSTGEPKGVMVEHRNLAAYLDAFHRQFNITEDDTVIQQTSISFDAFVEEMYPSLTKGGRMALLNKREIIDVFSISRFIARHRVGMISAAPQVLNELDKQPPEDLRSIHTYISGGDELKPRHIGNLLKNNTGRVYNTYGPTESTVCATYYEVPQRFAQSEEGRIPIGNPIDEYRVYILGRGDRLQPVGTAGELCVAGAGVARGYMNRPELTAERFSRKALANNALSNDRNSNLILYRTGDQARWLADGNIEFLGRIDHQVKIRGYRIELGEVENRLLKLPAITDAVVQQRDDGDGEKYLAAYYETAAELTAQEIRVSLSKFLPDYMIPAYIIRMESLPYLPSGKIDRRALPEPVVTRTDSYEAPRGEVQKKIVQIWAEVLGLEESKIGINTSFFEMGGHSLKAIKLVSLIHRDFSVNVPLNELFIEPSVKFLSRYVEEAAQERYKAIEPVEEKEYYVLSPAQKRLYILQQMDPGSIAYNMPQQIPMPREEDRDKLETVIRQLMKRHESLRTSFEIIDDEPVQRIHPADGITVEIETYEAGTEKTFIRPFNLTEAPLLRVGMYKAAEGINILLLDMHHIISDGTSHEILINDFNTIYRDETLTPMRLRYRDYAAWQNGTGHQQSLREQKRYWIDKYSDELPVMELPVDNPRPLQQNFEGRNVSIQFSVRETAVVKEIAEKFGMTLYMVLLAEVNILLSKLSSQEDIIVGTPVAARRHADLQSIIGMFVNTLPMRNYPEAQKTVAAFLTEVKEQTLEAFENQEYQFEDLVDKISVTRDTGRNPVFDVMYNHLNQSETDETGPIEEDGNYRHYDGTSKFDLNITSEETGSRLRFSFEYASRLFKEETVNRFIGYFRRQVIETAADTTRQIASIDIVGSEEKKRIRDFAWGIIEDQPAEMTIHKMYQRQAKRTPDRIALIGPASGEENKANLFEKRDRYHLSYSELDRRANRLAQLVRKKGALPDTPVGLMVNRSLDMIIGLLAILKAGCSYLPIDTGYPEERKRYMLEDCRIKLMIIDGGEAPTNVETLDLRNRETENTELPEHRQIPDVDGRNQLYIIYTSGSTGKPKGVIMEHRNLVNLIQHQCKYTDLDFSRVLQFSTIGFDVSFQEIFSTLLAGGRLTLIPKALIGEIPALFEEVRKNDIETLVIPTTFLKFVMNEDEYVARMPHNVKQIITAGEQLIINERCRRYLREKMVSLHNHYGPTETHVVTALTIKPGGEIPSLPAIGKPLRNTGIYILDKGYNLSPVGVPGELYIAGIQVGRGYLNRPELTAKKFIPETRIAALADTDGIRPCLPNGMSYQTGDLARWLPDGNIEFLGRIDHQVKIRGFRVEPGEIENRLMDNPGIGKAVVIYRSDERADNYLCAYLVGENGEEKNTEELRDYLGQILPDYMVPAYYVYLDAIPLNQNGKVDRRKLPVPEYTNPEGVKTPANERELRLQQIWAEILGLAPNLIGVETNFFEMGGHSLRATIMVSKIHKIFNVNVPLMEIFKTPTIAGIARYIGAAETEKYTALQPVEQKDFYELSAAQKRLYIVYQMDPGSTVYNMPYRFPPAGNMEKEKLEHVFRQLIARHESLRTGFRQVNDEPVQQVHLPETVEIQIEMLSPETEGDFVRPFELTEPPLVRVGLLRTPDGEDALYVDMHHIISDGISLDILADEFAALYSGETLKPLEIQYKDYSAWQNNDVQRGYAAEQEKYWLRQYSDELPVLNLPVDFRRPPVQDNRGGFISIGITAEATARIKSTAADSGVTSYMYLLAAFNILLAKLCGQEDVIVGTPVAGRRHADLQHIIGMFVNTLALRSRPEGDKSFNEFLQEVKQQTLAAFENQDYPFEELVEKIAVTRDAGRNPLFDVLFTHLNREPRIELEPGSSETSDEGYKESGEPEEHPDEKAKFDLMATASEEGGSLRIYFGYSRSLFGVETVKRFARIYRNILGTVQQNPEIKINDIPQVWGDERRRLLVEFNRTETPYPKEKRLHKIFEEHAAERPDRLAISGCAHEPGAIGTDAGTASRDRLSITYGQLNKQAGELAGELRRRGVGPDCIVGLMAERTVEMIVGIMGILKAGGAYLPLEPSFPRERIEYILKDSAVGLLVTTAAQEKSTWNGGRGQLESIEILYIESLAGKQDNCGYNNGTTVPAGDREAHHPGHHSKHHSEHHPGQLCYVMYTSGSTGKPKGTLTNHSNVVRVVKDTNYVEINRNDRLLQLSNYAFDGSVIDIFGSMLNGAALIMAGDGKEIQLDTLPHLIEKESITLFFVTTALFNVLVDTGIEQLKGVRKIIYGGDRASVENNRKALDALGGRRLINAYGPTETTVFAAAHAVNVIDENRATIPIGLPVTDTAVYILDTHMKMVPVGVAGELYIGGGAVCRGYLNNPQLTAQRFIEPSRLKDIIEESKSVADSVKTARTPLYRTGDQGRWLENGEIEFIGRLDRQVKLRGYRIELGEIENRLLKHEEIKDAAVIERRETTGEFSLCAYIVYKNETDENLRGSEGIREFLAMELPAYMIPANLVEIPALPLTHNGKLDQKALPAPGQTTGSHRYEPPGSETEKRMLGIWTELLEIPSDKISIHDDFFELGGHSLNAMMLTSKIHKEFQVKIPLVDVFTAPTVRGLCNLIGEAAPQEYKDIRSVEDKEYYELTPAQKRLFFLYRMRPRSTAYNIPEAIPFPLGIDMNALDRAIRQLLCRHESLRTSFHQVGSKPVQKVHPVEFLEFEPQMLAGIEQPPAPAPRLQDVLGEFVKPFDLSVAPLLRVGVYRDTEGMTFLLVDMHHIISDGVSHGILVRDFTALYRGETLKSVPLRYRDYAHWQNSDHYKAAIKARETFWVKQFEGDIPVLNLPLDYVRPLQQTFDGGTVPFSLSGETTRLLREAAQAESATVYMVVLVIYNILMTKLSGMEDIVIGTSVSGRMHNDLQQIIGMFVNTLPLRNKPAKEKSGKEFLEEVRERTLEAFENQEYQFESMVEIICRSRDISRNPLFDVMLSWQNMDTGMDTGPAIDEPTQTSETRLSTKADKENSQTAGDFRNEKIKFDLVLTGWETEKQLNFHFQYNRNMFKKATVEGFAAYFSELADGFAQNRSRTIEELDVVPAPDMEKIARVNRIPLPGSAIEDDTLDTPVHAGARDEFETLQVSMWAEILEKEPEEITIDSNFFEMGGHSLQVIMLVTKIHKTLDVRVPLEEVFKNPTIRELSAILRRAGGERYAAILPVEEKEYYPLSSAQKRLYVLQRMEPGNITYNMPQMVPLGEKLDAERLERTILKLIRRHESLRTAFRLKDDQPVQQVKAPGNVRFEVEKYQNRCESGTVFGNFIRAFDLSNAPLLRIGILDTQQGTSILMMDMHHIISDAASRRILVRDFASLFNGESLSPLRLQYKDYAQWQQEENRTGRAKKQERYWLEQFKGEIPVLELPLDYVRPAIQQYEGGDAGFSLDTETVRQLKRLAQTENVTEYMILLAVFNILMAKLSGQEDIVVGTPIEGRPHADLEHIIGMFVNTLAIRNEPVGEKRFIDFLAEVKQRTLEGFENQEYQFEELVEKAGVERNAARNPLFDVLFTWKNNDIRQDDKNRTSREPAARGEFQLEGRISKFDMTLTAEKNGSNLDFILEYCTALFKGTTIKRFIRYFKIILETVLETPAITLGDIRLVRDEERKRLVSDFNRTETSEPMKKTLHRYFEEQVEINPHRVALVGNAAAAITADRYAVTYAQLDAQAEELAWILRKRGVKRDTIVALKVERTVEMIVGIMGILKAGGAYMPIDPINPRERIDYMLKDSAAPIMVTVDTSGESRQRQKREEHHRIETIYLPIEGDSGTAVPGNTSEPYTHDPERLCYVIYTSGSTGKPKGTLTAHKNVVRVVKETNYLEITEKDRLLQLSNFAFDGSVIDIFGSLVNGAALIMNDDPKKVELSALSSMIEKEQITVFFVTTSLFNTLVDIGLEQMKAVGKIIIGGESASVEHCRKAVALLGENRLINGYGPTETTVFATSYPVNRIDGNRATIPIGRPLTETSIYILDKHMKLVPPGVTGELVVGGGAVCRGYLNNPELTSERFIDSRLVVELGKKSLSTVKSMEILKTPLYRTGDRARWMENGEIEFRGRIDRQVKIRGFRVELGEIENRLLKHPRIKEAVVIERKEISGEYSLCAYTVSRDEAQEKILQKEVIKDYLAEKLPSYMIPGYFVELKMLPLTPNGKLERRALPLPDQTASTDDFQPPQSETEKRLVEIWAEVLAIDSTQISTTVNFFDLGGQSLKATMMVTKIHQVLEVKLPLVEIFRTPTVKELAATLKNTEGERFEALQPVEEKEYYPLSSAQKRLYLMQQMQPRSIAYNIFQVVPLESGIRRERLEKVFSQLLQRHESFRTLFINVHQYPYQRILPQVPFHLEWNELKDTGESEDHQSEAPAVDAIISRFIRPFDLTAAPLMRAGLVNVGTRFSILMVDMHHIVSDGVSLGQLVRDFNALHRGETLTPLKLSYKDYAQWQQEQVKGQRIKTQEQYWLKRFSDEIPVLNLPQDWKRPAVRRYEGAAMEFQLDDEITALMNRMIRSEGTTAYMILLAVYTVLLGKLGAQVDVVIGTPVAGRRHAHLEGIVGMFVNTLAIRNYPGGEKIFGEFLQEVKERVLEDFENQEYPLEELVEKIEIKRDVSRNPLFDVMFASRDREAWEETPPGVPTEANEASVKAGGRVSKFDLTLTAVKSGERQSFVIEYSTALFKKATVKRIAGYFKVILETVLETPQIKLGDIRLVRGEERERLLREFNRTETGYPADKTLHRLFEEQVIRNPHRTAILGNERVAATVSVERLHLTYMQLNARANQLAWQLRERGVRPDTIVALKMERTVDMIIGIMGILKAGGAYLPIDPAYPQERIDFMLNDSAVGLMVTAGIGEERENIETLYLESGTGKPGKKHIANRAVLETGLEVGLDNDTRPSARLCYVIYTSGSTGKPKGTLTEHYNAVRVVKETNYIEITEEDRVMQLSNYAFDGSVFDIFGALLNGASLVMTNGVKDVELDTLPLLIEKEYITVFFVTTALFNTLTDIGLERLRAVRKILFGGERVSLEHTKKASLRLGADRIVHMYGPTETTVYASYHPVNRIDEQLGTIPIGRPLSNTTLYILDKYMKVVSIGVTGELYVGGDGVCRGYMNNPELTAQRFVNGLSSLINGDETATRTHCVLYKTGDHARWLESGDIEFIGRIDRQVKIRGFRVELGEIENRLLKKKEIKEAVVIARRETSGRHTMCAYIVYNEEFRESGGHGKSPKDELYGELPAYMIPSHFVELEALPLTANSKLDRKALPVPEQAAGTGDYEPPCNKAEKRMVEVWAEILEIPEEMVGATADFFELGGHSLKAMLLTAKIHNIFQVKVPLVEVFKEPTVRAICRYMGEVGVQEYVNIEPVEKKEYYVLSPAQKRLYFLQQMNPRSTAYNMPQTVPVSGEIDIDAVEAVFRQLVKRHESLRTSFLMLENEPVQRIHTPVENNRIVEYLGTEETGQQENRGEVKDFVRPFDLGTVPLYRVGLLKHNGGQSRLIIDMHHIISDGMSLEILNRDFIGILEGNALPELNVQYKDYAQWKNGNHQQAVNQHQEKYWLNLYEGEIPVPNLPLDYPRPTVQDFDGYSLEFQLTPEDAGNLENIAAEEDVTLYMLLLAIYNILLSKICNREDVVVGVATAGRGHSQLENVMGMFVNTLALRNKPEGRKTFKSFLQEVRTHTLEAFDNQDYPLEQLVEKKVKHREAGRNPLFDAVFGYWHEDGEKNAANPGEANSTGDIRGNDFGGVSKFDLSMFGEKSGGKLSFSMQYNTRLFKREKIERFIEYFKEILTGVTADKDVRISDINLSHSLSAPRLEILQQDDGDFQF